MTDIKTASFVDKSTWGRGPWDDEPDRVEWRVPEAPRLACLIVRGPMGSLCGYVGVPPGHPAHGKDFNDVDVEVRIGGLTYAAPCDEEREGCDVRGLICHVPQPGDSDDVWWLGFDCGHAWDVSPGLEARVRLVMEGMPEMPEMPERFRSTYKTIEYVRTQVEGLARQLAAMGEP
jgi:hypothetical protein